MFPLKLTMEYPTSLSRGQLLIKMFFGAFYVLIPHIFCLIFVSIWAAVLNMIGFWIVLFTGSFPANWWETILNVQRWNIRINMYYGYWLTDKYPPFSGKPYDGDPVTLEMPVPTNLNRVSFIIRALFGSFYIALPHYFCLIFFGIWVSIQAMIAWWIVLFTGKYPESFYNSIVSYTRWSLRVGFYLWTDEYPPFNGNE